MLKVVFDTNIFISALHWTGVPLTVYRRWLEGEFHLGISGKILSELGSVLENDFNWAHEETQELCNLINELADLITPKQRLHVITDGPDDNKILECALASRANYIISGDKQKWIEKLEGEGPNLPRPFADVVGGKIRELRIVFGSNCYRFLYFFSKRRIVITHGFVKKTKRLPSGEIEKAERLMQDFLQRCRGCEIKL